MGFKSNGICAHTVAAAEQNHDLSSYLSWYCKVHSKKPVNLFNAAKHDMPAGAGCKGGKASRVRSRKRPQITGTISLSSTSTPELQHTNLQCSSKQFTLVDVAPTEVISGQAHQISPPPTQFSISTYHNVSL
jgi:phosphoketolase